jgi:CRP-like cAMP-binding protein
METAAALLARPDGSVARRPPWSAWGVFVGERTLGESALAALDALSRCEAVAPGQWLVREHDEANELIGLLCGEAVAGFGGVDDTGADAFVAQRTLTGPTWIDASSAWCQRRHAHSVRAVGTVEVLRVPVTELRSVLLDCPQLAVFFLDLLSREIDRLTADMNDLLQKDAEARLASWLLRRIGAASAVHQTTGEIHLTERKRQIATQLGVKPETLSRLLRSLNRRGLVEVYGYRVRVLDAEGLKALAAG